MATIQKNEKSLSLKPAGDNPTLDELQEFIDKAREQGVPGDTQISLSGHSVD